MAHFQTDILIIGGGLAGLTAALHLQRAGLQVMVIEKDSYPRHKVCGEYISNEVLPYLAWLDADPIVLAPSSINRLQFSTVSGKSITTKLPMGGFGISRFKLDDFLYRRAISKGVTVLQDTVREVTYGKEFRVITLGAREILARQVIGAYGKRAAIDIKLERDFIKHKSPFLAVKAHYSGNFSEGLVALHNFRGGYCGVSLVEAGKINICYLADYATFKAEKDIAVYQKKVLYQNKHLAQLFENSTMLFDTPMTISQLSFGARTPVANHILMVGDTAGLIHPLCGNGMSMAIHSAKICAELLISFFSGKITDRASLEKQYTTCWNRQFRSRMGMGSMLSALLAKESLSDAVLGTMMYIPAVLPLIIRQTHGKTLTAGN